MEQTISGGCVCGAVRYRLGEEPLAFYACHCTDCQRQSGSAFGLSMVVRREALALERGEPEGYAIVLPDGRKKQGRRCRPCGCRLWGEPERFPPVRVLRPGTLDAVPWRPWGDIWTASAQPWVALTGGPAFEGQPEDPLAVARAWQERPR